MSAIRAGLKTEFASPERSSAEELSRAQASFAGETLLCSLLDAIPEFVMILDRNRQIVHANEALASFAAAQGHKACAGLRLGELLACDVSLKAIAGCGTAEECKTCGSALAILKAQAGEKSNQECRITSQLGGIPSAMDLHVWTTPLKWQGTDYVLLVAADISSVKRRQVLERIFFHDILNSAGNIKGIVDMLGEGAHAPEMVGDLRIASQELISEIHSQKTLLAAENNELTLRISDFQGLEAAELVARTFRHHPVGENRTVRIAPESENFVISSDYTLLARVLGNLTKNALEASDEGQTVTLGCRSSGGEGVFWCHNAKPMPREVQLQMFKRSFSTKGSGRGIGTYSVRLLTERYLKGRVAFASSQERGTVFTVTLPIPPTSD